MDGLAQLAAQKKPVNIGGQWFFEGVTIPQADAMKMLGVQPAPQQAQQALPQTPVANPEADKIKAGMLEQQRMQQIGQNPLGAGLAELFKAFSNK